MEIKLIMDNILNSIEIDWSEAEKRKKKVMNKEDIEYGLTHMFVEDYLNEKDMELKFRTFKVKSGNIIKEGYDIALSDTATIKELPLWQGEELEILVAEGYLTKFKNKVESMIAYYNYIIK